MISMGVIRNHSEFLRTHGLKFLTTPLMSAVNFQQGLRKLKNFEGATANGSLSPSPPGSGGPVLNKNILLGIAL